MVDWARENPGYTFLIILMILMTIDSVVTKGL